MRKPLHVLVVEDSVSDAELVARHLEHAGYELTWDRVDNAIALKAALARQAWDLILCDFSMPEFSGLEALNAVRAGGSEIPFIFVSGTMGEDTAVEAMKAGAQDYVVKGRLKRLVPAIDRELREVLVRQQRNAAEQAMRESEHKYRQLFESLSDAAFLVDIATRRIIDTNHQAEVLLGLTRGEIVGLRFGVTPQLQHLGRVLDAFIKGGETGRFARQDTDILRRNSVVPVHVDLTPVTLYERKFVLAVVRDITEHKQLEAQFRQAQKMEGIGQLAAGVAHDFNNLLAIIRGNTELVMVDGMVNGTEASGHLKQVIAATESAANLTRQLLLISRKQPLTLHPVDLNEAVQNLADLLRRAVGVDIAMHCEYSPRLPLIHADIGMVEQVLLNLAVNARDAMPRGGKLIVQTSETPIVANSVPGNSQAKVGNYVCLSVIDTGCGIPSEILPRIFEPFFTTKEGGQGTGLGLATAYGIVQQHQGWINIKTEVGRGSTFRVYFPAIDRPTAKPAEEIHETSVPDGTEVILLVEDEASLRTLMRNVLERYGYTVLEASSGLAALEVWQKHHDRIDLVLTDLIMPDGVTGPELAAKLQAERATLSVMYMSGYGVDVVGKDVILQEGVNFLQKPCSPQKLASTVRNCLKRQRGEIGP